MLTASRARNASLVAGLALALFLSTPLQYSCRTETGTPESELRLPEIDLPEQAAPPPATLIVVTERGIDIDSARVAGSWPRDKFEAFVAAQEPGDRHSIPLVERGVVKLSAGRTTGVENLADWPGMRELRQVLNHTFAIERRFHRDMLRDGEWTPRVAMAVVPTVPYETVWRVLTILSETGVGQCSFLSRRQDGRIAGFPACVFQQSRPHYCGVPRLTVTAAGLSIELATRGDKPGPARGQLLNSTRDCPSVPRLEGRIDPTEIDRMLRFFEAVDTCPEALVGAEATRSWGEVYDIAAAAVRGRRDCIQFFGAPQEFVAEILACGNVTVCPNGGCSWDFQRSSVPAGNRPPMSRGGLQDVTRNADEP